MASYILDTSALIAYFSKDPNAYQIKDYRKTAQLPFVVLTELYYVTFRKFGKNIAEQTMQKIFGWHLPVLMADEKVSLQAGHLKAEFRLGIADSFIAALTLAIDGTLITKDPDYRVLEPHLKLLYI